MRRTGPELAVRSHGGAGSAVVLLHGAARNLEDLDPLAARLVGRHRVVAVDLRNHGASGDGPWSWDEVVDDVAAVIAELGLTAPVVVGHSLGGMVAALCAGRPGLLRAAVNLDGHGRGTVAQYHGCSPDEVRAAWHRMRELAAALLPPPVAVAELEALCATAARAARDQGLPPATTTALLRRAYRPAEEGVLRFHPGSQQQRELLDAVAALDLPAAYRSATCPLLVVRATVTEAVDPATAGLLSAYGVGLARELAAVAAEQPLLQVRELEVTHGLVGTHPDLVAGVVEDFLSRL